MVLKRARVVDYFHDFLYLLNGGATWPGHRETGENGKCTNVSRRYKHTLLPTVLSSPRNSVQADFRQDGPHLPSSLSCLSSLPCDLHGLVYSYLEWREKLIFISLSKEISSLLSRSYREMRLKRPSSLKFALNQSFRERVCSLVLPCHVELELSWCHDFTDAALIHLGNVHSLNLSCCKQITDAGLCHLGNVHSLDLSGCEAITDAGLAYLRNVKKISLSGCHQITDEGLHHLGNLQSLDLSHCLRINDAGLAYLRNIKDINLSNCHQITDAGLRHLGNVQCLNLSHCRGFTDAGLAYLGNLKKINLSYCQQISNNSFRHLGNLQSLDLSYCSGFTQFGLNQYLHAHRDINLIRPYMY
jgi:hypothetical protein